MITNLVLVEHPTHTKTLYPFSILHLPWELRYGAMTIIETWLRLTGATLLDCLGRPAHRASFYARFPEYRGHQLGVGTVLIVSSRLLPTKDIVRQISRHASNISAQCFYVGEELVAFCCSLQEWEQCAEEDWQALECSIHARGWQRNELRNAPLLTYLWDLFAVADTTIEEQFVFFADRTIHHVDYGIANVAVLNARAIAVGENSSIAPLVVLDASAGPIIIGDNVTIMPQATIIGPCTIGDRSVIKVGAKIYSNTIIGPSCKVGGEVECTIFQSFSNKQHDGFIGHSFISEWVNLGAGANTSNLKNTYRPISVELPSGRVATGRTFLGLLCGDHTKAGIATMFSTGTVVGISTNIFGAGYSPTTIPSFTWGGINERRLYAIDVAIDTARRSMARRNRQLLPEEEALLHAEYQRIVPSS